MLSTRRGAASFTAIAIAGVLAFAASFAARPVGPRIPKRLDDTTFWRMVTQFSESGGKFPSENFVSNENEWQYVIPAALKRVKPGGVYLGVGPEQNFTYIAALQPGIAFICDIRRQNLIQHLMYKALIEMSADRADFLSRLWSRSRPPGVDSLTSGADLATAFARAKPDSIVYQINRSLMFERLVRQHKFTLSPNDSATLTAVYATFFAAGPDINYGTSSGRPSPDTLNSYSVIIRAGNDTARSFTLPGFPNVRAPFYVTFGALMAEDDGGGVNRGWLGSEEAFRKLKDFQTRNLLVPIVGRFEGEKALRAVAEYVKEIDARVTTYYTSNVEQYLFQQGDNWARFYANVGAMNIDDDAIFIRSFANQRMPRKPMSRLAQATSSIQGVLRAFNDGKLRTYSELADLSDR